MRKILIILIGVIIFGVLVYLWSTPSDSKTLVKDGPSIMNANMKEIGVKGYEIIDLRTKNVWLSTDYNDKEFHDLDLPFLWIKNDSVRVGVPDGGKFLKSPGCSQDEHYNEKQMFGKDFLHVTKLDSLGRDLDDNELLRKTSLEKHHEIFYFSGRTIRLIINPNGVQYILVSRDLNRTREYPQLPDGWEYKEVVLNDDLTVTLSGNIEIIRTDNNDSFQGPLDENFQIIK